MAFSHPRFVIALLLLVLTGAKIASAQEPTLSSVLERLDEVERRNAELARQNEQLLLDSREHKEELDQLHGAIERLPEQSSVASDAGAELALQDDATPNVTMELEQKIEQLGAGLEQVAGGAKQLEGGLVALKGGVEKLAASLRITTLDSDIKIGVFGWLRGEMLLSDARPVIGSAPFFISPDTGLDQDTVDVHGKSTGIGAGIQGPCICGYESGGLILVYFFGNQALGNSTGVFLAQAYGELKSEDDRLAFGVQSDVFNPVNPTVLNWGMYGGAGNTGYLRGQLRYEYYIKQSDVVQWTLTGALSNPAPTNLFDSPEITLLEDNGVPNVEGRVALGLGSQYKEGLATRRPLEVGVSGVLGELRATQLQGLQLVRVESDVWGAGVDAQVAVTEEFGLRGELYTGQGLGTYSGAIVQLGNIVTLDTIRSSGGWGEVYYYFTPCVHTHVGYCMDNPEDDDLALGQRTRNEAIFANLIWDVTKNFQVGCEVSHWETDYRAQPDPLLDRFALGDNEAMIYHLRLQYAF